MSRDLPSRPDLEHLKKQAKALLRDGGIAAPYLAGKGMTLDSVRAAAAADRAAAQDDEANP